ncbi:MAG: efflux RND transporter periplasmic adaptor subunit [Candidatus Nealsonbacteria bacterium]
MHKNKIIIASIIIFIIIIAVKMFSGNGVEKFETVKVERGDVFSEVTETGQVQKGDKLNLSFKNSGRVSDVYVETGDNIQRGALLMKLDTSNLSLQLKESQSSLNLAQVQLDKLIAGLTPEEIQKYQTAVNNKEIALGVAEQSLSSANEDALNTLEDAYLKSYNAYITVNNIQILYFKKIDQEGISVKENKDKIQISLNGIKSSLYAVKENFIQSEIDSALSNIKTRLSEISSSLTEIRETTESPNYRNDVTAANKTLLDAHRGYINTVLSNLTNDQQAVVSAKLSINTAQGNLQAAKDDLAFITAEPREEDINLYQNQVNQAQISVDVLNNQISDSYLRSPVKGQVTDIMKRVGELAQASFQDTAVVIAPADPYKIEVNIYEEDVVDINIGNPANIMFVAFPGEIFTGKVISIDPAENLIDGVVYYKTVIGFDETPEGIKPGMTADLDIRTDLRENVLILDEDAIQKKDDKIIVEVLKDGVIEEREISIGLEGSNDLVEILSGLEEREEIILR